MPRSEDDYDGCVVLSTKAVVQFPGLKLVNQVYNGVLLDKERSEYNFVIIAERRRAMGPRPLVWLHIASQHAATCERKVDAGQSAENLRNQCVPRACPASRARVWYQSTKGARVWYQSTKFTPSFLASQVSFSFSADALRRLPILDKRLFFKTKQRNTHTSRSTVNEDAAEC